MHHSLFSDVSAALAAKTDLWGEEAMREEEGPSYAFFAGLLPPLRYVNAPFRHYPLVLSAPKHPVKARLVSNGSSINAHGDGGWWRDAGLPVTFRVGQDEALFGDDLRRLDGPRYRSGYLPVVEMAYRAGDATFSLEVFAAVEKPQADSGVVFAQLALRKGKVGRVAAVVTFDGRIHGEKGILRNDKGQTLVLFDSAWNWDAATKTLMFLFTDIEGSTKLWEPQPQAMQAALARHDALLRQDDAAFNAAWAEGRALTMEQAIVLALGVAR